MLMAPGIEARKNNFSGAVLANKVSEFMTFLLLLLPFLPSVSGMKQIPGTARSPNICLSNHPNSDKRHYNPNSDYCQEPVQKALDA